MKTIFFLICKKNEEFKRQKVSDYSCFLQPPRLYYGSYLPNKQFIRFNTIRIDIVV